ncbi:MULTISPECIES: terminase small subunit [Hyphobacterium]|uniref:Terminase small subunit n=1 Tax=Hyphobacterium vulgare TaxID=1736751 RepID=A0ABV6ZUC6_9PROT
MAALKNARHEAFARALAKGMGVTEAYVAAGYRSSPAAATRLSKTVKVSARLTELQNKGAERAAVTAESLSAELEEARSIALAEKQVSAAVSATMGKAKLFGIGVEHRRVSGTIGLVTVTPKDLEGLTEDELASLERAYPVLEKLGLVGGNQSGEGA